MIDAVQFRDLIIRPTLKALGGPQDSEAAVELLLATALHESRLTYLKQIRGPALGVYQMEPATFRGHVQWLLTTDEELFRRFINATRGNIDDTIPERLVYDLRYATLMARIHYWRVSDPLPEAGDAPAMAKYWKDHYNTHLGAGTEEQFLSAWANHMPEEMTA